MTLARASADSPSRGRTRVTSRALSRVVAAVAAESLDVPVENVRVELGDERGALAVTVSTRVAVTTARSPRDRDGLLARSGGALLERSERAQRTLRDRVPALTGARLGPVTIRFTGAAPRPEERVR